MEDSIQDSKIKEEMRGVKQHPPYYTFLQGSPTNASSPNTFVHLFFLCPKISTWYLRPTSFCHSFCFGHWITTGCIQWFLIFIICSLEYMMKTVELLLEVCTYLWSSTWKPRDSLALRLEASSPSSGMYRAWRGLGPSPGFYQLPPLCIFGEVSSRSMNFSIYRIRGMTQDGVDRAVQTLIFRETQEEGIGEVEASHSSFLNLRSFWTLRFCLFSAGNLKGVDWSS